MPDANHDLTLITKAVGGDQVSLQKLLVAHTDSVVKYVGRHLPTTLRDRVDPEDITQQTLVEAFRSIGQFRVEDGASFGAWLIGIADNIIKNTIRRYQRVKRGGKFQRVFEAPTTGSCSVRDLAEHLSAGSHSPSHSAMGHEAVDAVQQCIDGLSEDYRQAVRLRLLEGKSLEETASIMTRSPRAVQGLVDRAKKKMRAALGRLSNYR